MSAESLDSLMEESRRFEHWCNSEETKIALNLACEARQRTLDSVLAQTPSDGNTVMQLIGEARGQELLTLYVEDRRQSLKLAIELAQRQAEEQTTSES